jgi:hypothetical protein
MSIATEFAGALSTLIVAATRPAQRVLIVLSTQQEDADTQLSVIKQFAGKARILAVSAESPQEIADRVKAFSPHIIHLLCESKGDSLVFSNLDGTHGLIPVEDFVNLLQQTQVRPRLVLINSSNTAPLATAMSKQFASLAIGVRGIASGEVTLKFAVNFYYSLRAGSSMETAFSEAQIAVGTMRAQYVYQTRSRPEGRSKAITTAEGYERKVAAIVLLVATSGVMGSAIFAIATATPSAVALWSLVGAAMALLVGTTLLRYLKGEAHENDATLKQSGSLSLGAAEGLLASTYTENPAPINSGGRSETSAVSDQEPEKGYPDYLKAFDCVYSEGRQRLLDVITQLNLKANVNLVIGLFLAVGGIASVVLFLNFEPEMSQPSPMDLAVTFGPRVGLISLVEILAIFFLKLYRDNIIEIRYFQNEITNMETKYSGLRVAALVTGPESAGAIVKLFMSIDRNATQPNKSGNAGIQEDVLLRVVKKALDTK